MDTKKITARISPGAGDFMPALMLGQDWTHPKERNGKPCFYYWKPALVVGRKNTWSRAGSPGKPIDVTPERIQTIVSDYKRAVSSGYEGSLPDDHLRPTKNYGWLKDARIGQDGSLELLHQFVGEEEKNEALNKKTSICTLEGIADENGNKYTELIDHNAIIVNPQLNSLGDFTPAIAASRGQAIDAVQFELSAPSKESKMDLTKLRASIGAANEVTDDDVIAQAVAKLTESIPALQLSRSQATTIQTETARANQLATDLEASKAKVLELSRSAPDQSLLEGNLTVAEGRLQLCLDRGQATDDQAKIIREHFFKPDGKPGLMLSRSAYAGPIDGIIKLLELNRALEPFRKTDAQPVGITIPGAGNQPDPLAAGIAQGKAYADQQMAERGLAAAK